MISDMEEIESVVCMLSLERMYGESHLERGTCRGHSQVYYWRRLIWRVAWRDVPIEDTHRCTRWRGNAI